MPDDTLIRRLMNRLKNHFALVLGCYTAAWLCVAPSLVLCVCDHDRAQIESRTHATASCSDHGQEHGHEHSHGHSLNHELATNQTATPAESDHSHNPSDHADRPLLEDDIRVEQPDQFAFVAQPISVLTWMPTDAAVNIDSLVRALPQNHGPPNSVDRSLRSTILLI